MCACVRVCVCVRARACLCRTYVRTYVRMYVCMHVNNPEQYFVSIKKCNLIVVVVIIIITSIFNASYLRKEPVHMHVQTL